MPMKDGVPPPPPPPSSPPASSQSCGGVLYVHGRVEGVDGKISCGLLHGSQRQRAVACGPAPVHAFVEKSFFQGTSAVMTDPPKKRMKKSEEEGEEEEDKDKDAAEEEKAQKEELEAYLATQNLKVLTRYFTYGGLDSRKKVRGMSLFAPTLAKLHLCKLDWKNMEEHYGKSFL